MPCLDCPVYDDGDKRTADTVIDAKQLSIDTVISTKFVAGGTLSSESKEPGSISAN